MLSVILSFVIAWLLAALIIFVVGRLGLGMTVDGFVPALIAAAVIAIVSAVVLWLLSLIGIDIQTATFWGALVALVVSAIILMISDRFVAGMHVGGFVPAVIAAIAIGIGTWLVNWVLGLFGI